MARLLYGELDFSVSSVVIWPARFALRLDTFCLASAVVFFSLHQVVIVEKLLFTSFSSSALFFGTDFAAL